MKKFIRLFALLLILPGVLLLAGCATSGSASVYYGVYGGYGYPYYGNRNPGCCYDRPDRPDKPVNLPSKPGGPSIQPVPRPRPSAGMGQPSRSQMSRPSRAPRAGRR